MVKKRLYSMIDKAIFDFDMLQKGSKILIGASGGKDSTLLIEYLANRLKSKRPYDDFSFEAIYIKTDFADDFNPELYELMKSWGVEVKTLEVNTLERVKEGFKMNCWWCSTQRRKELIDYALKNGFTNLALGHHLDDILETFLMNLLDKSEMNTMVPSFQYKKYPLRIIRPLAYAPVDLIKEHAENQCWKKITCTCTYQDNSGRKDARSKLEALTDGDLTKKSHIMKALKDNGLLVQTEREKDNL